VSGSGLTQRTIVSGLTLVLWQVVSHREIQRIIVNGLTQSFVESGLTQRFIVSGRTQRIIHSLWQVASHREIQRIIVSGLTQSFVAFLFSVNVTWHTAASDFQSINRRAHGWIDFISHTCRLCRPTSML